MPPAVVDMHKHGPTILIVEDDGNDRRLIRSCFERNGVTQTIHMASDGEEAIAYMTGEGKYGDRRRFAFPAFIMIGLKMPPADGLAVLEFLKRDPAWSVIPAVVLSPSADPDAMKKAYALGASAYHVKPKAFDEWCRLLRALHAYWMQCEVPEAGAADEPPLYGLDGSSRT